MWQANKQYYTPEEYFRLEDNSTEKHEYYNGEIFGMAGGTPKHNVIMTNIAAAFVVSLRGKPCTAYSSEMKIATKEQFYSYADLSVVCGEPELLPGRNDTVTNPVVIVEVLSPSTENYDRGKKFELYRAIKTLQSYLLIDQSRVYIEHHHKLENGNWLTEFFVHKEQVFSVPSIEIELSLADIYDKVRVES